MGEKWSEDSPEFEAFLKEFDHKGEGVFHYMEFIKKLKKAWG